MTVYVDDMYSVPMGQFGRMRMSHMIADTEDELHAMAARIGVARRWYQGDHYDVAMSKRAEAIRLGAVAISMKTLAFMAMHRRAMGYLPQPEEAERLRAARLEARQKAREALAALPPDERLRRILREGEGA